MTDGETAAQAMRRVALQQAVDYHARKAHAPTSKGSARAETVTATAEEFWSFLRKVADEAGVEPDDLRDSTSDTSR